MQNNFCSGKAVSITYSEWKSIVLDIQHVKRMLDVVICSLSGGKARLKRDGTRAETRFGLSAKWTSPFKLAGSQFSRLLAAEVCASAVVMLDTHCSEVECKTTGYPLHSHFSASLPLPCVCVCHHISTELYHIYPHYFINCMIIKKLLNINMFRLSL